jgi:hypothetical protein
MYKEESHKHIVDKDEKGRGSPGDIEDPEANESGVSLHAHVLLPHLGLGFFPVDIILSCRLKFRVIGVNHVKKDKLVGHQNAQNDIVRNPLDQKTSLEFQRVVLILLV